MDNIQAHKRAKQMMTLAIVSAVILIATSAITALSLADRNSSTAMIVAFIMILPVISTVLSFALTAHDLKTAVNEDEAYVTFQRGKICGFLLLTMSLVVLALIAFCTH